MDFLRIYEACMKFPCKTGYRTLRLEVLRLSRPTPTTLSLGCKVSFKEQEGGR